MDPYEFGYNLGYTIAPIVLIALVLAVPTLLIVWRIRSALQPKRPVVSALEARRDELRRRSGEA